MKTFFALFGTFLGILIIFTGIGFYTGYIQNFYDATVTKQHMNIERTNYEQSASYVQGKIDELSKDYAEYNQTADPTAKTALLTTVRTSMASFDINNITDPALQNFLLKARGE